MQYNCLFPTINNSSNICVIFNIRRIPQKQLLSTNIFFFNITAVSFIYRIFTYQTKNKNKKNNPIKFINRNIRHALSSAIIKYILDLYILLLLILIYFRKNWGKGPKTVTKPASQAIKASVQTHISRVIIH